MYFATLLRWRRPSREQPTSVEQLARESWTSCPSSRCCSRISSHPEAASCGADLSIIDTGLRLRVRIRDLQDLGPDARTRLQQDAGFTRTSAACTAKIAFDDAAKKAAAFSVDGESSIYATLFADAVGMASVSDVIQLQASTIEASIADVTQEIETATKGLHKSGEATSWKHQLADDAPLAEVLSVGNAKLQGAVKGNALRELIEKMAQARNQRRVLSLSLSNFINPSRLSSSRVAKI